jgi:hypothetical protein
MTRNLLLLLHLAAVAAWLGANFTQFVVAPRLRRYGAPTDRHWSETSRFLGQRYYNVVGVVVAVSGVALVLHGHWHWRGFVLVGIATVVIGAALGIAVFEGLLKREAAELDAGDLPTVARIRHNFTAVAVLDTLLVLVTMLAMIDKWHGATG